MILLGTTILIDILKGNPKATSLVEKLSESDSLYTSTINIYEIMKGIYTIKGGRKKYLNAVGTLEANLRVLQLSKIASEEAAKIYATLEEGGQLIGEADCLIAGVCRANKIGKIATRNSKHFKKIKGLQVLGY